MKKKRLSCYLQLMKVRVLAEIFLFLEVSLHSAADMCQVGAIPFPPI